MRRLKVASIAAVVAGCFWMAAASASAQETERFRWRGRVDGSDEIHIGGDSVRVRHLAAQPIREQDYRFTAPLPQREVRLSLRQIAGRSQVALVEEPNSWNNYTAVVRIDDREIGDDYYEFELFWFGDTWDDWGSREQEWGANRQEGVFRWAGRVDIGADIEIRGDRHRILDRGGAGTQERQATFTVPLPRQGTEMVLYRIDGRGDVNLIQIPDRSNNYTAVVRITDESSGSDYYGFELRWR